ncbi:MAG: glucose-6-phosphate isomerase, partial [Burkholderiaceae bacterium]
MKDWRADQLPVWADLVRAAGSVKQGFRLTEAFAEDPLRQEKLSIWAPEIFADFSKALVDMPVMGLLQQLAREAQIESRRDEVLSGGLANLSEGRAALHTALRAPRGQAPHSKVVHDTLDEMLAFADEVRDTRMSGIRHIVNIGIGGSDLGPQMAVAALDPYEGWDLSFDFVSNVDGQDIARILRDKMPEHTLFVIASKTFTTQETMSNAMAAKTWFLDRGGRDLARHFVATTSNVKAAREFGIDRTFSLWDWVGGRYSIWSSIGLPIALAIGSKHFRDFLSGAHAMDVHFAKAPLAQNLPIQLALLDVWYRNFMGFTSRSIAPYHHGLRRLPAYLQQLEMESNGKGVS